MFTSRAEFRLLLRHDNADLRLMETGYRIGLIPPEVYEKMLRRKEEIEKLHRQISAVSVQPELFNRYAADVGSSPIAVPTPLKQLLKRPETTLEELLRFVEGDEEYSPATITEVAFAVKYEGFLKRQLDLVAKFKRMESTHIPDWIDYDAITSLSAESREKLKQIKPASIGQAARISGVRQSDLAILMIHIEKNNRPRKTVSRETVGE